MIRVFEEHGYREQMEMIALPYNRARENEKYVERTAGEKIHLCTYRADHAKAAVVISHGYTESIIKYQEVIYYFLSHGYHVFMAEHCGHGKSYRLNDDPSLVHVDSYMRYVSDLLFVAGECKKVYPDLPMYLYAHSMGGGIGAAAIATEPKLFDKALLTSPMIRPLTGGVPWAAAKALAGAAVKTGHGGDYAAGQKPYSGLAAAEERCGSSIARHLYYEEIRMDDVTLQTCACSFGWIYEAAKLNDFLRTKGWKKVEIPVLLMQAEEETLVSKSEQHHYIRKIAANKKACAKLMEVPNTRHEIFNATSDIQIVYWKRVFDFLSNRSSL